MSQSESVIVCEGYFDRAFWHGLLMHHFKCTDQRKEGPWGRVPGGGVYGFTSPTGRALRIVPTNTRPRKGNSRNPVFQGGELFLQERQTQPIEYMILNIDADTESAEEDAARDYSAQLLKLIQETVSEAVLWAEREVAFGDPVTCISLIPWHFPGEVSPPVPQKQTLERLVSVALGAVYPERAKNVTSWLDSRVDSPKPSPKEVTWSYMAGWHAELGCEAFFKEIWRDSQVADELIRILQGNGSWEIITRFTE
ncbi:hypothetical protein [Armatimonas sp.]|uniref:hypothetical protein n=1 Tax=Armatimonas sp. TaxID=1872638 RepID=UPI00374D6945